MSDQRSARPPRLFGLHAVPPPALALLLAAAPFLLALGAYLYASHLRLAENPSDKLLPSLAQMLAALQDMAFEVDAREDARLMLADTIASLKRLGMGIGLAALIGLILGLNLGVFVAWRVLLLPFVTFVSIVPPLALLPILFIAFGVDELAKVMLIFIGTFPMITRDLYTAVKQLPPEQRTKALTLGASGLELTYCIVLPQLLPRLLSTVRLSLGAGWLFLIASEAIAAEGGLGYRIFLVRRYLAMDIIIPYALWITFLGFGIDTLLKNLTRWAFPWYDPQKS